MISDIVLGIFNVLTEPLLETQASPSARRLQRTGQLLLVLVVPLVIAAYVHNEQRGPLVILIGVCLLGACFAGGGVLVLAARADHAAATASSVFRVCACSP